MRFDEAVSKARILRRLKIDDVSSVSEGAGRGVKVVLRKSAEEVGNMAEYKKCPTCKGTGKVGVDDDADDVGKVDHATIAKASQRVLEDIATDIMKNNPRLSRAEATVQATMSAEYSAAHVAERKMRLGY
jgi:RecJ-like exonuclease